MLRRSAIPLLCTFAALGCGDDAEIAIPSPNPAAQPELLWSVEVTSRPPTHSLVDVEGGLLLLTAPDALGATTLSRVSPDGSLQWSSTLESVPVVDLEATADGFLLVTRLPDTGGFIDGVFVEGGNAPVTTTTLLEIGLDGSLGEPIRVLDDETLSFVPAHADRRPGGGYAVVGRLFGTVDVGSSTVESGLTVLSVDAGGALVDASWLGEPESVDVYDLTVDREGGEIFVAGAFSGLLEIGDAPLTDGPSPGDATFLLRLGPDLEVLWATHAHGEGRYEAHPLPGGHVLLEGAPYDTSYPLALDGSVHAGPMSLRLDATGSVVDAVSLGSDVSTDDLSRPYLYDEHDDLDPLTLGTIAMAPTGALVTASIERSWRQDGVEDFGAPIIVADDVLTLTHQAPGGHLETLLSGSFPNDALALIPRLHPRADGSVAVVVSTNAPFDIDERTLPPGTHVVTFRPSSL